MLVLKFMGGWKRLRFAKSGVYKLYIYMYSYALCTLQHFQGCHSQGKIKKRQAFFMIREKSVNFFLKSGEIVDIVKVSELYPLCTHNPLKSIKRLKMK